MNEKLLNSLRAYTSAFDSYRPPFFDYAKGERNASLPFPLYSERFLRWVLIRSALHQGIDDKNLDRIMLGLYHTFKDDLFSISTLPIERIEEFWKQDPILENWDLLPRASGIVRSVSDFFLVHGSLKEVLPRCTTQADAEELLCQHIFFFGKKSAYRFKARIFLYIARKCTRTLLDHWNAKPVVWPPSLGWWKAMRILIKKDKDAMLSPEESLELSNRFYQKVGRPDSALIAFVHFRKKVGLGEWACRTYFGSCPNCPLYGPCPGVGGILRP